MFLADLALDDRGGGNAVIYYRLKVYKRVSRPDGKAHWFDAAKPSTLVDRETRALMEYAYQNPKMVRKAIRFTRSEPGAIATANGSDHRIAELVEQVFTSIADRRQANMEIGFACIELKELVGRGKWLLFFERTFSKRLNLRTAERYMRLALTKQFDKVSNFLPSISKRTRKMDKATEQAAAEVAAVRRHDPASVIEGTINALRRSPYWRVVSPQIIAFLRQLCRKYGVAIGPQHTERSSAA